MGIIKNEEVHFLAFCSSEIISFSKSNISRSLQIPRPILFLGGAFFMFCTHVMYLIFDGHFVLWIIAAGTGIGYGSAFTTANALIITYFGSNDGGLKIGTVSLAPAISGTLATFISGGQQRRREGKLQRRIRI